jgi:nuclear pore complex protein Nup155
MFGDIGYLLLLATATEARAPCLRAHTPTRPHTRRARILCPSVRPLTRRPPLSPAPQLVLLGVTGTAPGGTLGLQPLPQFTCPSDGMYVSAAAATNTSGRLLLGGDDGGLYEFVYSARDSWRQRRCAKITHASAPGWYLPSPVRRLWAADGVRQIVVDEARGILYTRSTAGALAAYDLGAGCASRAVHRLGAVASVAALLPRAAPHGAGGGGARPGGGGGAAHGAHGAARADDPASLPVGIAVVSRAESRDDNVTLVALLGDGRRAYFSAFPRFDAYYAAPPPERRPSELRFVGVRDAPPHGGGAAGAPAAGGAAAAAAAAWGVPLPQGLGAPAPRPLKVDAAFYADGLMLLSDMSLGDVKAAGAGESRLVAAAADAAPLPAGAPARLRESVALLPLPQPVAAETGAMAEAPPPAEALAALSPPLPARAREALARAAREAAGGAGAEASAAAARAAAAIAPAAPPRGELSTQHALPPRRVVVLSGAGVLQLHKARPVDSLAALLDGTAGRPQLESFFAAYGHTEAAAMCVQLAVAPPDAVAAAVSSRARAALDNSALVGDPRMSDADVTAAAAAAAAAGLAPFGFNIFGGVGGAGAAGGAGGAAGAYLNMGLPVVTPEVEFSHAHAGAVLHAARLLRPAWGRAVAVGVPRAAAAALAPRAGGGAAAAAAAAAPAVTVPLAPTMEVASLAALEGRLRALAALLADRAARRHPGGVGAAASPYGGSGEPLSRQVTELHKKRRLEDAVSAEARAGAALRELLLRAAEACALLALCDAPPGCRPGEPHFGEVSLRLDGAARAALCAATLRTLAAGADGPALCDKLVEALRARHNAAQAGGPAAAARDDALGAALARRCPTLFPPHRATLFRAAQDLDAAAAAPAGSAARAAAVRAAADALLSVPSHVPLPATAAKLVELSAWQPLCDVALAAAAPVGTSAERRELAYGCVTDALRGLALGAADGAADTPCGAAVASLHLPPPPAPGRDAALRELLAAAGARAERDVALAERVFGALADASSARAAAGLPSLDDALLTLPAPRLLDAWLAREGCLDAALARRVPLTGRQARLLALLARARAAAPPPGGSPGGAARVCAALALRAPPPPGEPPLPLAERYLHLSTALTHARSQLGYSAYAAPDPQRVAPDEVNEWENRLRVLSFQARLVDAAAARAARGGAPPPHAAAAAAMDAGAAAARAEALERLPLDLSTLYNDYATVDGEWGVAIEMFAFSGHADPGGARATALWDDLLASAALGAGAGGAGGAGVDPAQWDSYRALNAAAAAAAATGAAVANAPAALPLERVALRLELMAAGAWPASGAAPTDNAPVAPALLQACRDDAELVAQAYEALLAHGHTAELRAPPMRLRLLRSLASSLGAWAAPLLLRRGAPALGAAPSPHAAGVAGVAFGAPGAAAARAAAETRAQLVELCDRHAAEADRLQVARADAEALAHKFHALRHELMRL